MKPTGKPRVIKDYDNLDDQLKNQVLMSYPDGFSDYLISFTSRDGTNTHGILHEVEDKIYLIRLSVAKATSDFDDDEDDDDYDVLDTSSDLAETKDDSDD